MGAVGGGDVVGTFSYGSRGSQGWGVLQVAGRIDMSDAETGVTHVVRLQGESGPTDRVRRLVWDGDGRDPRRFLIRTIEAGPDASNRPHNNFSQGLVVRRSGNGDRDGVRPSQLWSSPVWPSPYGASAVAAVDLAQHIPLTASPEAPSIAILARRQNGLTSLATLLGHVEQTIRTGDTLLIGARTADAGALYLDFALSLMAPELQWEATFEVSSQPLDSFGGPGPRLRMGLSSPDAVTGPGKILLDRMDATVPVAVPCARCGLPEETWASLTGAALWDIDGLAEQDPQRAMQAGEDLVAAIARIRRGPEPVADRVWDQLMATSGPWQSSGSRLRSLAGRLPRNRHEPLPPRRAGRELTTYAPVSAQALARYLSQPLGAIGQLPVLAALNTFATQPPSPGTVHLAQVLLDWTRANSGQLPDRLVIPGDWWPLIALHRQMGDPAASAAAKLQSFRFLALNSLGGTEGSLLYQVGPAVRQGVIDVFRASLIVASVDGTATVGLERLSSDTWRRVLAEPCLNSDWTQTLSAPFDKAFVSSWLGPFAQADARTVAWLLAQQDHLGDGVRGGALMWQAISVSGPEEQTRLKQVVEYFAAPQGNREKLATRFPVAAQRLFVQPVEASAPTPESWGREA